MKVPVLLTLVAVGVFGSPSLSRFGSGSLDGTYSLNEVEDIMLRLAKDSKHMASVTEFGSSDNGSKMKALEITSPHSKVPVSKRPVVLFTSLIVPREPLSLMTLLYFVRVLTAASPPEEVSAALSNLRFIFVPIMNPDSYSYIESVFTPEISLESLPRKNRAKICTDNSTLQGVNLVHNFNYMWDTYLPESDSNENKMKDIYDNTCNFKFHGGYPFSEPETIALRDLIYLKKPVILINLRQLTQPNDLGTPKVIFPYQFHPVPKNYMHEADLTVYNDLVKKMNENREKSYGNYEFGSNMEIFGETSPGSCIDWAFDQLGVWSFEVFIEGPSSNWPKKDELERIVEKHFKPLLSLSLSATQMPQKKTKKHRTTIRHALYAFTVGPFFAGFLLLVILSFAYLFARYVLGYDKIWDRFVGLIEHFKRWRLRKGYSGVSGEEDLFSVRNRQRGHVELSNARKRREQQQRERADDELFVVDVDEDDESDNGSDMDELAEVWRSEIEGTTQSRVISGSGFASRFWVGK